MALSLSDFQLEKVAFEIRYPPALMLWDHSGALWVACRRNWPDLRPIHAQPDKTAFRFGDSVEMQAQLEKSLLLISYPTSDLATEAKLADDFVKLLIQYLDPTELTRVGLRLTYFRRYDGREEAAKAVEDLGLMRLPPKTFFGIEGTLAHPQHSLRWESESAGVRPIVKADTRTVRIEPPFGLKDVKPTETVEHGVELDVDYYTVGSIKVGSLKPSDWIQQVAKAVRRGCETILEGK